ncbi:MAG: ATP-binding protein [Desulfobulbaceae bacterium]|nr:ATP-binding protein [Desulfobulbaceae bacterium]
MKGRRLLWQIFPPMALVMIATVIGATFFASLYVRDFYLTRAVADLTIRAQLVLRETRETLLTHDFKRVNELCLEISQEAQARMTVILADGTVVADSVEEPAKMDNHSDREEVVAALAGNVGVSSRFSRTTLKNMIYVAVPVSAVSKKQYPSGKPILGVVRLAIPLTPVSTLLQGASLKIMFGSLAIIVLGAIVTLSVSRKISRPLEELQRIAQRFGQHNFDQKITFTTPKVSREVAGLSEALNQMAFDLNERIETVTQQKNELEAVFKSMIEAVIVIDINEKIERMNEAALRLLGLSSTRGIGKAVVETIRNVDFLKFVRETLSSDTPIERELVFGDGATEQHFHSSGTMLFDSQGHRLGALIVLNDVTKMRQLETVRREFVANVSHELKTPITAIKGFIETICDGDGSRTEDTDRFLKIVLKQANRLNAIVDDLLALSRIEQEEEHHEIELQRKQLKPILENSVDAVTTKALEKDIQLTLQCEDTLSAQINAHLLEQAVTNLVINAIKYSHEKGEVRISASQENGVVTIQVTDFGCGIAKEHLPRLFERFYRSDKARSRKLGGTGLGLAIVKHIIQAHGGSVSVQSALGKGSCFSIRLSQQ